MNISKFKLFIISILSLTSLNGCSLEGLISSFDSVLNNINSVPEYGTHEDTGKSIELLDNAFNGKVDKNGNSLLMDFTNVEKNNSFSSNTKRLSLDKTIQDFDYWQGTTPSTGNVKGLVVPVDFSDAKAKKITYDNVAPSYQSVASYYYNSSYGKLNLDYDVTDWITLSKPSTYYASMNERNQNKYAGDVPGASAIIEEVLKILEPVMDLSKYDNDKDGYIDSLHIIYSHKIDNANADFWWAYQYCSFEEYKVDGVTPYFYVFASYDFLLEDSQICNARTYIHETGHLFGLEDYYDYDDSVGYNKGGLGGADMMDNTAGDHNPYSKMALGWIKDPILVDLQANETTDITINNFDTNGDTIMICDEFNKSNGLFQSYFLLSLYNVDAILNKNEFENFVSNGIRLYRVHSELEDYKDSYGTYKYYKYNNTDAPLNLIDTISNDISAFGLYSNRNYQDLCAKQADFYIKGDGRTALYYTDSYTSSSYYSFSVTNITDNNATIRITKKDKKTSQFPWV